MITTEIEKILGRKVNLVHPKDIQNGDYTLIADEETAQKDFEKLEKNKPSFISKVEFIKPRFINIYLSKEFFADSLKEIIEKSDNFGKGEHAKGFKVMVEHTQPNPFKEFHVGHLMNNAIGEAVARIIRANGAEVKTASYHGDVGLHVAKTIWDMKNREMYMIRDVKDIATSYVNGSALYETSNTFKNLIDELNKTIYEKTNPEINRLYELGREVSLKEFEKIYAKLGSKFDFNFFESDSAKVGKSMVGENIGKVFEESEGAVVFKGEKVGLHTRVFLNSDKLPTYEAKEVGLAKIKKEKFPFDLSVTITANEQDAFFDVVEVAIGEVFPELKGKLKHLSHGVLKLPTGKMSSRTGNIITAEELIEKVKELTKDDEQVAIGAIKYMILRQSIGNDIVFDFEKSVSTEGDSGVYLQYAHARACSVLEKAKNLTPKPPLLEKGEGGKGERIIERLLYRFPEIVERAGKDYAPNYVINYLTELASSFNNFYANNPIIGDDYRLAITKAFKIVMKNGLTILGIPAPERM